MGSQIFFDYWNLKTNTLFLIFPKLQYILNNGFLKTILSVVFELDLRIVFRGFSGKSNSVFCRFFSLDLRMISGGFSVWSKNTFRRLLSSRMKWSKTTVSQTGVHYPYFTNENYNYNTKSDRHISLLFWNSFKLSSPNFSRII